MNAACLPPRPHFFGDKGQEWREEPVETRERQEHRRIRRFRPLVTKIAVAARLRQFQIVVAEVPEERFDTLEHPRVVVVLETTRRFPDQVLQITEDARVEDVEDLSARF